MGKLCRICDARADKEASDGWMYCDWHIGDKEVVDVHESLEEVEG